MADQPSPEGNISLNLKSAAYWAILVTAGLLLIGGMRMAAVVFAPIVLGIVLALLLEPIVERLSRGVPRWLASILALIPPILVVLIVGWFAWYTGQQVATRATKSKDQYAQKWEDARSWLTDRGIPEHWLPGLNDTPRSPDSADAANQPEPSPSGAAQPSGQTAESPLFSQDVRDRLLRIVVGGLGSLAGGVTAIGFSLAFCLFALLEAEAWQDWVNSWSSRARSIYTLSLTAQYAHQVRRYLFAKAITGAASGIATWLFLWAMGVPLSFIWGGLTFILNFIPNIGALLSGIPPTLLAFAELGTGQAFLVVGGLVVIELLSGNVLEPVLHGDFLKLSPFLMLASLLFWGWVWGLLGAVLAPMLTAAAVAAARQVKLKPKGAEVAEVVSAEPEHP